MYAEDLETLLESLFSDDEAEDEILILDLPMKLQGRFSCCTTYSYGAYGMG